MIFTSDHICVSIPYMLGEVYYIFLIEPDQNVTPYSRDRARFSQENHPY
jgi:hypothetical protein